MRNLGARYAGPDFTVELRLRGEVAAGLINAAIARGMTPIDLLSEAITAICSDNLFNAVLDDEKGQ